jgi:hypothetical protein
MKYTTKVIRVAIKWPFKKRPLKSPPVPSTEPAETTPESFLDQIAAVFNSQVDIIWRVKPASDTEVQPSLVPLKNTPKQNRKVFPFSALKETENWAINQGLSITKYTRSGPVTVPLESLDVHWARNPRSAQRFVIIPSG